PHNFFPSLFLYYYPLPPLFLLLPLLSVPPLPHPDLAPTASAVHSLSSSLRPDLCLLPPLMRLFFSLRLPPLTLLISPRSVASTFTSLRATSRFLFPFFPLHGRDDAVYVRCTTPSAASLSLSLRGG
ncbi:hypothetical protein PIB30_044087, partial [Stylosanthes scabra]|nr:hypothetical protein [Stylosanthes scabra]